ncbi:MAG: serine/threonine protein kinase [Gammaproteobacteria bacterium PRO9]|nr:serine/threonine protein kinase [Gammaproteobacteria bacterium PRO9]
MAATGSPDRTTQEAELPTSSAEERRPAFAGAMAPHVTSGGTMASGTLASDTMAGAPADLPPPEVGDFLKDRYVLLECLAQWSASRLFRAEDRRLAERHDPASIVTLKVVTAPPGAETGAVQALRREAAIAGGLDHPNLLRIHGLEHDGPHTFLCMDWREAESLGTILDARGTRPMTRVQAVRILEGICQALGYLHSRRIVHGDIKPGNILMTAEGGAILIDFGVASGPGADDLPQPHGCTPEYASPEVLRGESPTPADDLYSVAGVAYRMLGGQRAFGTATALEAEATGSRPACPEQVSPAQWRALDCALSFRRADRQPDVDTFINQLKGLCDDGSTRTILLDAGHDEPAAGQTPPRGWHRYWPLAAGALLMAAGGWLLSTRDSSPRQASIALPAAASPPLVMPAPGPLPDHEPEARADAKPVLQPANQEAPVAAAAMPPPTRSRTPEPEPAAPAMATPLPLPLALPLRLPLPTPATTLASGPAAARLPDVEQPRIGMASAHAPAAATTPVATSPVVPLSSLRLRHYVEPHYPRQAAVQALSGTVRLAFMVGRREALAVRSRHGRQHRTRPDGGPAGVQTRRLRTSRLTAAISIPTG